MKVTFISGSKRPKNIEDYRKNFSNIRKFIDSPHEFNSDQKRKLFKHFFEGEKDNFTRSNIAKWEMYRINPNVYPSLFKQHINELCDELDGIQNLRLKTIEKKQEIYPKTSSIRDTLVKENRVVFDKIQPKLNGIRKLLLRIKIFV